MHVLPEKKDAVRGGAGRVIGTRTKVATMALSAERVQGLGQERFI